MAHIIKMGNSAYSLLPQDPSTIGFCLEETQLLYNITQGWKVSQCKDLQGWQEAHEAVWQN